jgi:hypothetical protein
MLNQQIRKEVGSYILSHPEVEDTTIAARFGWKPTQVGRERRSLGLYKRMGAKPETVMPQQKMWAWELGTREDVLYALTEGGKSIPGILREKNLDITRQRAGQILKTYYEIDAEEIRRNRTVGWYARHLGKPKLARRSYAKKWLDKLGNAGFARKLKISENTLKKICLMHGLQPPCGPGRSR